MPKLSTSYYEILRVSRSATGDEIHAAYRARARELHPDIVGDSDEQQRRMQQVNEAFDVLGDPDMRRVYDGVEPAASALDGMFEGTPEPPGFSRYSYGGLEAGWRHRLADANKRALSLSADSKDLGGLAELADDGLWLLVLSRLRIVDADLDKLRRFHALEVLRLDRTKVTDAGLDRLAVLSMLRELNLSHCRITDAGMPALRSMLRLEELFLYGTDVTDAGVRELAFHPTLRILDLRETSVSGECLPALVTLSALRELRLPKRAKRDIGPFRHQREDVVVL